jgi:hypothetical protein
MVLDVTGALTVSVPLGLTDSIAFNPVPSGTYTLSVRGINAAGMPGASSNAVTLTFPGACSGPPQPPANLVAYREGRTVFVVWDPPDAGAAPTGYLLNVTGAVSATLPTSGRTLSGTVGPGTYILTISSTNACGTSAASAAMAITVP